MGIDMFLIKSNTGLITFFLTAYFGSQLALKNDARFKSGR
jgi:hypothetical protein